MKYSLTTTSLTGAVLATSCLMVPPTPEGHIPLILLAFIGGALCAYVHTRCSLAEISLEKSAIIGGSAGLMGGVLCFATTAAVFLILGNTDVVLNLHSFNLAIVGLVELTLSAVAGGLAAQLLWRGRHNAAVEKDRPHPHS